MRDEPGPGHRRTSAPLLFAGEQVQYTVVRLLKLCWQKNRTAKFATRLSYGPGSGGTGKIIRARWRT